MIKLIKWFERQNKFSWIITLVISITIFYISSLTFEGSVGSPGYLSIIYHFSAFAGLCFFLNISLIKGKKSNKKLIFIAIIISIIYGISDEIHQYFVPGRACTIFDVIIDSTGILFSGIIYNLRLKFK